MARTVYLHVGTPKTGTSYVQDILFHNPEALAAQGVRYPTSRHDGQFLAALDLMRLTWGGLEHEAVGAWENLARETREAEGTVIISHEIFGTASAAHAAQALADLGDAEVHVVLSARDLVRQIPAEWQENVKHRRVLSYAEFLKQIRDPRRATEIGGWFWGVQELPAVLDRWGSSLPPERVHVVTVPRPGAPRDLLWQRFAGLFGIDPGSLTESSERANASMGVAETALVRRLNRQVNDVVPAERYRQFVREVLVHQTLSQERRSPRLTVPPDVWDWAVALQGEWSGVLRDRGYHVVGDLADLTPDPVASYTDPDDPDPALVADAGVRGLTALVREAARLRDVEVELHGTIDQLNREIDDYHRTFGFRVRNKVVRMAEDNLAARASLGAYRALRGRNSRST